MDSIFYFVISIIIAFALEIGIADAISNTAGLTGFQSVLLLLAVPGFFITYVLVHSANQ